MIDRLATRFEELSPMAKLALVVLAVELCTGGLVAYLLWFR